MTALRAQARVVSPDQMALVDVAPVPPLLRAAYETGVRESCSPCAAAGRDALGMPYRIADDPTPLCLACWRRRERESGRRGTAAEPVEWVEDLRAGCAACGERDPQAGCWLCGWSWLAAARAESARWEREQFAAIAARSQAVERVAWLTGWVWRLRTVVAAYTDPGRRGGPAASWGRAVELLADVLARDAAARSSGRGRPPVALRRVAGVMAVNSDKRSGHRAMPGRAECAELAGVCERAVSTSWRRGEKVRAWILTEPGRRLTLAERRELQRGNNRAVFDLRPVHRSTDPAARDAMIPAALAVLDELQEHAEGLLADAQHALDALDAPTRGTGRAPDAATIRMRAERARLRQAVATTRRIATAFATRVEAAINCTPHTVAKDEHVSSCLRGSGSTFVDRHPVTPERRPRGGRGKNRSGATRSPMRSEAVDLDGAGSVAGQGAGSPPLHHPRTPYGMGDRSQGRSGRSANRRRPGWAEWAYPLAAELRRMEDWLQDEPVTLIASTLGARLGPRWTAAAIVDFLTAGRGGRKLPQQMYSRIGLLREMLEQALTGTTPPPYPARRWTAHQQELAEARRSAIAAQALAAREQAAETAAAYAARDQAAAAERVGPGTGRAAARAAALAAATKATSATTSRETRSAAAWAEHTVAQPGSGQTPMR